MGYTYKDYLKDKKDKNIDSSSFDYNRYQKLKEKNRIGYDTNVVNDYFNSAREIINDVSKKSQNVTYDWAKRGTHYDFDKVNGNKSYVQKYINSLKDIDEEQYNQLSSQFNAFDTALKSSSDYIKNINNFASQFNDEKAFKAGWNNVLFSEKYKDLGNNSSKYEEAMKEKFGIAPTIGSMTEDELNEYNWLKNKIEDTKTSVELYADYEKAKVQNEYDIPWWDIGGRLAATENNIKYVDPIKQKAKLKENEENYDKYFYNLGDSEKEIIDNYENPFLTGKEREKANTDYFTWYENTENADEILKWYSRGKVHDEALDKIEEKEKFAEEHPVLASGEAFLDKFIGTPETGLKLVGAFVNEKLGGDDYYDPYNSILARGEAMQNTVSEGIDNEALQFLYDGGMSIANMIPALAIGVVTKNPNISLAIMGTQAGVSEARSAVERGTSLDQALLSGIAAGLTEAAMEKIPLDNLFDLMKAGKTSGKAVLGNLLKQAGTEGAEEGLTTIANTITDNLINRDLSQLNLNISNYEKAGYSPEEARKKALTELGIQIGLDSASGALSGVVLGGGATALSSVGNYVDNRNSGKKVVELGNLPNLVEAGKQYDDKKISKLAGKAEKKNGKPNYSAIGKLQKGIAKYEFERAEKINKIRTDNALAKEENVIFDKLVNNKELTEDEKQTISNNEKLSNAVTELEKTGTINIEAFATAMSATETNIPDLEVHDIPNELKDLDIKGKTIPQALNITAQALGLNEDATKRFVENFKSNAEIVGAVEENDISRYAIEFAQYHSYGRMLTLYNSIDGNEYKISEETRLSAYEAGKNEYVENAKLQYALTQAQKKWKQTHNGYKKGIVDTSRINKNALSPMQRASVDYVSCLAEFGVNVEFYQSQINKDTGKLEGENGHYNPTTHTILIDVNALSDGKKVVADGIIRTAFHEMTHIAEHSKEYDELRKAVIEAVGAQAWENEVQHQYELFKETQPERFQEMSESERRAYAANEATAEACTALVKDSKALLKMAEEHPGAVKTIINKVKEIIAKIQEFLAKHKNDYYEIEVVRNLKENQKALQKVVDLYDKAVIEGIKNQNARQAVPDKVTKNTATEDGVQYRIRDSFYQEYDAWDGKDTNIVFTVGTTSDALKSIGMKNQKIQMRSGMILQKINKHPEISRDTFRNIPELLEHPIIVQFSDAIDPNTKKPKYDSRITVLGELYAEMLVDGKIVEKPVLVSLELLPTNQKKTKILDVSVITSAYGHTKLQSYLLDNSILYIEPNKKRTNKWLSLNRLQLPLGENQYGSIRKITYVNGKVKIENSKNETPMERALKKAGVIDDFGNIQSSVRDDRYFEAVKSNDLETTQKLVDEVAKEAGYTFKAYHGTTNQERKETWNPESRSFDTEYKPFTVFKKQYDEQIGHFFNDDADNAGGYGSKLYSVYLKLNKPLVVDCKGQNYASITSKGLEMDTYEWAEYAHKKGYDGVIFKNISDGVGYDDLSKTTTDYVAFDSNQIKSAEPVTYDDKGNVIPLSKRFTFMQDIRYSARDNRFSKALSSAEWKKYNYAMISGVDAGLRINDHSILVECEKGNYSYKIVIYDNETEENNILAIYGIGENLYNEDITNFDAKLIGKYLTNLEDKKYDNEKMLRKFLRALHKDVGYILGRYNTKSNGYNEYGRKVSKSSKNNGQQSNGTGISNSTGNNNGKSYSVERGRELSDDELIERAVVKSEQAPDFEALFEDEDLSFDFVTLSGKERFEKLLKDNPTLALDTVYSSFANAILKKFNISPRMPEVRYNYTVKKILSDYNIEPTQKAEFEEILRKFIGAVKNNEADFAEAFNEFIAGCKQTLNFSSVPNENETLKTVKEVVKGKKIVIPDEAVSEIISNYGSIRNFRNKLLGHRVYVALEKNVGTDLSKVNNAVRIDDLAVDILSELGYDVYNGATAYEYDGHEWDSLGGFYNLEHLLNDPKLATKYSNPYLDGRSETIDIAAVQMAFDTMIEFLSLKNSSIEYYRQALNKAKQENYKAESTILKYKKLLTEIDEINTISENMEKFEGTDAEELKKQKTELLNKLKSQAPIRQLLADEKEKIQKQEKANYQKLKDRVTENYNSSMENRKKAESKRMSRRIISELNKFLYRAKPENAIKDGQREVSENLLALCQLVFSPTMSNEEIVRSGFTEGATPREKRALESYAQILRIYEHKPIPKTEKAKLYSLNSELDEFFKRTRISANEANMNVAFDNLANAYSSLQNSDLDYIRLSYDPEVLANIEFVKTQIKGQKVKDLSFDELELFRNVLRTVYTSIRNSNKLFSDGLKGTYTDLSNTVMNEVMKYSRTGDKYNELTDKMMSYVLKNITPVYLFRRIGSDAFTKVFWEVQKGEQQYSNDLQEIAEFKDKMMKKYDYKSYDFKKSFEFTDANGVKFTLTRDQIMEIFVLSRREQGMQHLLNGGFTYSKGADVVETEENESKKSKKDKLFDNTIKKQKHIGSQNHPLTGKIIDEITSMIDNNLKNYAIEMQKFLSVVMAAKGNEISQKLYGVNQFNEEAYWQITASSDFIGNIKSDENKGTPRLKHLGFIKPIDPEAKNPVEIKGFEETWDSHCNKMAYYHSLTLPLEDLTKISNFKNKGDSTSIEASVRNAHGSEVWNQLAKLIEDFNGKAEEKPRLKVSKAISLMKKNAVLGNIAVIIQQPTAILRAMAYINPVYFQDTLKLKGAFIGHKAEYEQMIKYCPVAFIKQMGSFDVHKGTSGQEYLSSGVNDSTFKKVMDKSDDFFGKAPQYFDEIGWISLWHAVQRETEAKHNLKLGTEENLVKAGERLNEIIILTQVYDSMFSRSGAMRSNNEYVQALTSFMGEPTLIMNMAADAIMQYRRNKDKSHLSRVFSALAVSSVATKLLASLIYALRDDDEEKGYWEKYGEALIDGFWDIIIPLNYFPILRDVYSTLAGYTVERPDTAILADIATLHKKCTQDGADWMDTVSFISAIPGLLGIPTYNVWREIKGGINTFGGATNDVAKLEFSLLSVYDKKYEQYWNEGYTEQECKSKALSDCRSKITRTLKSKYLSAIKNKDISTANKYREYMYRSGYYDGLSSVDEALARWRNSQAEDDKRKTVAKSR